MMRGYYNPDVKDPFDVSGINSIRQGTLPAQAIQILKTNLERELTYYYNQR